MAKMEQDLLYVAIVVRDYEEMRARGVVFVTEPKKEPYGTVAVFQDLYGNLWDLLELKKSRSLRPDGKFETPAAHGV